MCAQDAEKRVPSCPWRGVAATVSSAGPSPLCLLQPLLTPAIPLENEQLPLRGHHRALWQGQRLLSHSETFSHCFPLGRETRQNGHICCELELRSGEPMSRGASSPLPPPCLFLIPISRSGPLSFLCPAFALAVLSFRVTRL